MQEKQRFTNGDIVTPYSLQNKDLLVDRGSIVDIIDREKSTSDDWKIIDVNNNYIFPGMIDVLQHGFLNHLYIDVDKDCIANNSKNLPAFGVTGYLPSTSCLPPNRTAKILTALSEECDLSKNGSRVLGIHSEGPCFALPGAHNPKNLLKPSVKLAEELIDGAKGKLKAVTLAPEMDGSEEFIKKMKKEGISVHLGHSSAKPTDVPKFADWGVDAVTHMYDALPTYPADDTGVHVLSLTDALIAESRISLGLICDGIHVHPQLVELLSHLPSDRVFLETDANKYAGKDGITEFEFYPGRICISEKGKACTYKGMLAGSSLTSIEALQNYFKYSKKTLSQVSIATSLMPAKIIGMDSKLGSIEKGKLADFILLDKINLEISETYISGKSVYKSE
jgi:N-acetylglucosamine-6-phosphate deacetylase